MQPRQQQQRQQAQLMAALRKQQQEELLQLLTQAAPQQLLLIEVQGQSRLMTRCISLQQDKLEKLHTRLRDDEQRLQQQQPPPQAQLAQVQQRLQLVQQRLQLVLQCRQPAQPQGAQIQQQLDQLEAREQAIQEALEQQLLLLSGNQPASQPQLAQLQADVLEQQLGLQAVQQHLQRTRCQLQKLVPLVVQPSQQRDANQQQMQLYNALIVVAGLLLSATYSAMYASPVPDDKTDLDWSIRMVNGVAFGWCLICVVSCLMNLLRLCYVPTLSGSEDEVLQCFSKGQLLSEQAESIVSSMFLVAIASFVVAVAASVVASILAAMRIMGTNTGLWASAIGLFAVAGLMCAVFVWQYNCFKRIAFKH